MHWALKAMKNSNEYDGLEFIRNMEKAVQLWPKIIEKWMQLNSETSSSSESMYEKFNHIMQSMQSQLVNETPESLQRSALKWWEGTLEINQKQWQQFMQVAPEDNAQPDNDKRFRHDLWESNPYYKSLKDHYKLTAQWMEDNFSQNNATHNDSPNQYMRFVTRHMRDALSPSNYPWTNPEVMAHALDTNGQSVVDGLNNLLHDFDRGRITMTPNDAFTIGKDIACTEGSVVFENEIMQLIQYKATTKKVFKTPLLLIPAWINKFYILDLQPKNSLIKWLTDKGHTVFVISWVNPDKQHQHLTFEDYLMQGAHVAVQQVLSLTGEKQTHIAGYCLGGTLTACLLAWLEKQNKAACITSATFLTTLIDFEKAGDLKLFTDETQLKTLEKKLTERGYLEGNEMAAIFNVLRPQDLIWSFVVNNYLLGKAPMSFDLLYWNGDVTRMPAKMHLFYLREMYLNNNLIKKKIKMAGQKIDLSLITAPSYILATEEDHIAPWVATYTATQTYAGSKRYVLSGSGHIAGVINHPSRQKYGWKTNPDYTTNDKDWLANTTKNEGSWWDDWQAWLVTQSSQMVKARTINNEIEPAPGSYVLARA